MPLDYQMNNRSQLLLIIWIIVFSTVCFTSYISIQFPFQMPFLNVFLVVWKSKTVCCFPHTVDKNWFVWSVFLWLMLLSCVCDIHVSLFVSDRHLLQQQPGLLHIIRLQSERRRGRPQPSAGREYAGQQEESSCLHPRHQKGGRTLNSAGYF